MLIAYRSLILEDLNVKLTGALLYLSDLGSLRPRPGHRPSDLNLDEEALVLYKEPSDLRLGPETQTCSGPGGIRPNLGSRKPWTPTWILSSCSGGGTTDR